MIDILPISLLRFNRSKFINSDPYGQFIFRQVDEWATLMEEGIAHLEHINTDPTTDEEKIIKWVEIVEYLRKNAEPLSLETKACEEGLTGFQQDCATSILITSWKYGYKLWLALLLYNEDHDRYNRNTEDIEKALKLYHNKQYMESIQMEEDMISQKEL